mmetsp:Transcript_2582/g.6506  ORF Transcript_2582/g.6506 Transcript_2582/m.6506 type:complete len:301 (-) Transcript_2582:369-1271(-)
MLARSNVSSPTPHFVRPLCSSSSGTVRSLGRETSMSSTPLANRLSSRSGAWPCAKRHAAVAASARDAAVALAAVSSSRVGASCMARSGSPLAFTASRLFTIFSMHCCTMPIFFSISGVSCTPVFSRMARPQIGSTVMSWHANSSNCSALVTSGQVRPRSRAAMKNFPMVWRSATVRENALCEYHLGLSGLSLKQLPETKAPRGRDTPCIARYSAASAICRAAAEGCCWLSLARWQALSNLSTSPLAAAMRRRLSRTAAQLAGPVHLDPSAPYSTGSLLMVLSMLESPSLLISAKRSACES